MGVIGRGLRKLGRLVDPPHRFLAHVSGVVHVGANHGQERRLYAQHDLDVLWVEPSPEVYDRLVANIAPFPRQRAVCALLTDAPGQRHRFQVANNGGVSSSILDLHRHKEVWPAVDYDGHLDLISSTVDAVVGADGRNFDALVVDAQGAELLVLQGAAATLPALQAVAVEAADFEAYRGGTTVDEVVAYLEPKGFVLARKDLMTSTPGVGAYFDLLFRRR